MRLLHLQNDKKSQLEGKLKDVRFRLSAQRREVEQTNQTRETRIAEITLLQQQLQVSIRLTPHQKVSLLCASAKVCSHVESLSACRTRSSGWGGWFLTNRVSTISWNKFSRTVCIVSAAFKHWHHMLHMFFRTVSPNLGLLLPAGDSLSSLQKAVEQKETNRQQLREQLDVVERETRAKLLEIDAFNTQLKVSSKSARPIDQYEPQTTGHICTHSTVKRKAQNSNNNPNKL